VTGMKGLAPGSVRPELGGLNGRGEVDPQNLGRSDR
jgi:hypothetical protein